MTHNNYQAVLIHTRNSVYEVDTQNKRVRRMSGKDNPTPRQGADGAWRAYASIFPDPPTVGSELLIMWEPATTPLLEGSPEGAVPTTITSPITQIDPVLS